MTIKNILIKYIFNSLSPLIPGIMGKIAYSYFIRAPKLEVKPHHLEFFKSAEWIDLYLNEKKVQVYKWGEGEKKILLLHGWASNSFWWRHHIRTLSLAGFTVYAMDAPANGMSEGNSLNLKMYTDAVKLLFEKTSTFEMVAGHSYGGFVTICTAFMIGSEFCNKIAVLGSPDKAQIFFTYFEKSLEFSPSSMKALTDRFYKELGNYPSYYDTAKLCKGLEAKGLIIHDREDEDTPYQCSVNLAASWTNAKFITTEGLGHSLKDEKVYKWVLDFAKEA